MGISGITYVEGDLFGPAVEAAKNNPVIIPHVVNSAGVFGSGFVVPLGRHFPRAKEAYHAWHEGVNITNIPFELGNTLLVSVTNEIDVAHMLAQTLGGSRPLYYNHLARCMDHVGEYASNFGPCDIHAPAFGSGLAGGNWFFIEQLINDCWLRRNLNVTIYYLPGTMPDNWTSEV